MFLRTSFKLLMHLFPFYYIGREAVEQCYAARWQMLEAEFWTEVKPII